MYFNPEDWKLLHEKDSTISLDHQSKVNPDHNPNLHTYFKKHLKELFTNYCKIDIVFLGGMMGTPFLNTQFTEYCWELQPDLMVTRSGKDTPSNDYQPNF